MKKTFLLLCATALISSCSTITKTATTANVPTQLLNSTIADLEVSPQRISTEYNSTKSIRRGGEANVLRAAEYQLLNEKAPGHDVLVAPEYITMRKGILKSKIKKVIVSGFPAKYKNFRAVDDSVWCNKPFRDGYIDNTGKQKKTIFFFKK